MSLSLTSILTHLLLLADTWLKLKKQNAMIVELVVAFIVVVSILICAGLVCG